jgi:hypothetical protein
MTRTIVALTALALTLSLTACGEQDYERDPLQTGCGATHPKVGFAAALETHHHNVSGTVVAVDDCTLEIRDFTYDGGGVDVRLTGARGEAYASGITLSDNMLGEPADGETRSFSLPEGITLDDFDHLSIWCVLAAESFGDGQLKPAG